MLLEIDFGSVYFSNPVETVSCMSATNRCMHRYLFDTPCRLWKIAQLPLDFLYDWLRGTIGGGLILASSAEGKFIQGYFPFARILCLLLAVGTTMLLCKQRLNGKFSTLANRVLCRYIRMLKQLVFAHSSLSAVRWWRCYLHLCCPRFGHSHFIFNSKIRSESASCFWPYFV